MTRAPLALGLALVGIAATLTAGYAAGGQAGLTTAAAVAAAAVLIVARGTVRGEKPPPVRPKTKDGTPPVRAADFPRYQKIVSDLEWARLSRRHYQHAVRPLLTRLAAAGNRPDPLAGDLPPRPDDADRPGVDLATLDRVITRLEEP